MRTFPSPDAHRIACSVPIEPLESRRLLAVGPAGALAEFGSADLVALDADLLTRADRLWLRRTASDQLMEIALGELAQENGVLPSTRNFGATMVDEHTALLADLESLADTLGVPLPAQMGQKDQRAVNRLEQRTGRAFDRAYSRLMVREHSQAVRFFRVEGLRTDDPEIESFVTRNLATLRAHLAEARRLRIEVDNFRAGGRVGGVLPTLPTGGGFVGGNPFSGPGIGFGRGFVGNFQEPGGTFAFNDNSRFGDSFGTGFDNNLEFSPRSEFDNGFGTDLRNTSGVQPLFSTTPIRTSAGSDAGTPLGPGRGTGITFR